MTDKPAAKKSPRTIVVVDDSPLALRLVKHALGQSGEYFVLCASGAVQARDLMSRHRVDLAIVDIVMPHESGFELADWIRSESQYEAMPILFFSADAVSGTVRRAAGYGNVDYLLKPLKPNLLRDKVARLLESASPAVAETDASAEGMQEPEATAVENEELA